MRNECECAILNVKSSIHPTWPIPSKRQVGWLKEIPCLLQPSQIIAEKEQQCEECGRNQISIRVLHISR
jgi:hypothetical protein